MKKFYTVVLTSMLVATTSSLAYADKESKQESFVIKASYALPKKDGDEFRQTLRESDQENLQIHQQIMQDHADMYDLLIAPDFKRRAFLSKSADVRKLQSQEKENRDDAFGAAVAQLTPDERITLANSLDVNAKAGKSTHHYHKSMAGSTNAPSGAAPVAQ